MIIRSKGSPEWIVEDVYCDCYEQRSMAFLAITNNQPYGFVVLQPIGNALHVWAAWSSINDEDLLQQAWQEIQDKYDSIERKLDQAIDLVERRIDENYSYTDSRFDKLENKLTKKK